MNAPLRSWVAGAKKKINLVDLNLTRSTLQ
jgi:hypothetical protein